MDAISPGVSGLAASVKPANLTGVVKMKPKTYAKFFLAAKSPAAKIQKLNKIILRNLTFKKTSKRESLRSNLAPQVGKKGGRHDLKFSPRIWQKADGKLGRKAVIRLV